MTWAHDSFTQMLECGISKSPVRSSLKRLAQVEQEIGLDLTRSFLNPRIGRSSSHGSEHVVRVMFWVLVLARHAYLADQPVSDEETTAALYAAFCHDLARQNEWVDGAHGQNAAEHFQTHLTALLPEDLLKRCLIAMRVHSEPDPHDDDVVWMLVKDADSLDRGRFGTTAARLRPGHAAAAHPEGKRAAAGRVHLVGVLAGRDEAGGGLGE